ncbi:uncharacterized protein LOC128259927 [Drosophila gunungcola]|uniref:Uncharacterized protein n=1 Tax=Drosophila gunungcola TaxID=103775 RepID=A0A9Q0BMD3_9MUSC|nr:uncharacterized protein LOC128259927 [Drosophila gunungcola]XP_052848525.1 uncharacterized protein LOC128259927 [Drosophila gunungcola]KAI8037817.1 hypothetical protein M5D96_009318 [Drosophila gunungcola]
MIQTELTKIDDALDICYLVEEDLYECLNLVKGMTRKSNAPGRYTFFMDTFMDDCSLNSPELTDQDASSLKTVDSEMDVLSQLCGARSAQELVDSYVNVRYKFIKLKRDLEGTMSLYQKIADCADRQERVSHRMLEGSWSYKKRMCRH